MLLLPGSVAGSPSHRYCSKNISRHWMFDPCSAGWEIDMTQNACTQQTLAILYCINGMMQNNCGHSKCVSLLCYSTSIVAPGAATAASIMYRDIGPWACLASQPAKFGRVVTANNLMDPYRGKSPISGIRAIWELSRWVSVLRKVYRSM